MMRVPFPDPKREYGGGVFPTIHGCPGYLDLGTAVAVVTMLSSDYVSW